MKIILITLGFQPFRTSGFDVSGERLVQALLEDGHLVTVIAAADGVIKETMIHERLKIYRLPMGSSDWIGYAFRANQLLKTLGGFDVVHFWDIHFAYACPRRFVATLHQSFRQRMEGLEHGKSQRLIYGKRWLYYAASRQLVEPFCLRKAAGLMAVSATTKREFVDFYKVPQERISLTRHGLDVKFFKPYENREEDSIKYWHNFKRTSHAIFRIYNSSQRIRVSCESVSWDFPSPQIGDRWEMA